MPESTLFTAAQYAALAGQQVGKPYVLGANGPERFDCSGLVLWLNRLSGAAPMADMTAAGLYALTVPVRPGDEKPGDLVFLANNPARKAPAGFSMGIGHVAPLTSLLSNRDWEIIEARGRAYGVVRTTLSYWRTRGHYAGIRRLPGFKLATTSTPPPTPAATLSLRVATLNGQDAALTGSPRLTAARLAALVKAVVSAKADVYLLNECPERVRFAMRDGLPGGRGRWLVWERGSQAILWDGKRLAHSTSHKVNFPRVSYQGGIVAPLVDREAGRRLVFGSYHLTPNSRSSEAEQRKQMALMLAEMRRHPGVRIVGGDGVNDNAWLPGWDDARIKAASSSTRDKPTYAGKAITDRIHSDRQTPVDWRGYNVRSSGVGSDHDLIVTAITIPASVPTT